MQSPTARRSNDFRKRRSYLAGVWHKQGCSWSGKRDANYGSLYKQTVTSKYRRLLSSALNTIRYEIMSTKTNNFVSHYTRSSVEIRYINNTTRCVVSVGSYFVTSSENPVIYRVSQKSPHTRCRSMLARASGDLCASRYRKNASYNNDMCSKSCCQNVQSIVYLIYI